METLSGSEVSGEMSLSPEVGAARPSGKEASGQVPSMHWALAGCEPHAWGTRDMQAGPEPFSWVWLPLSPASGPGSSLTLPSFLRTLGRLWCLPSCSEK